MWNYLDLQKPKFFLPAYASVIYALNLYLSRFIYFLYRLYGIFYEYENYRKNPKLGRVVFCPRNLKISKTERIGAECQSNPEAKTGLLVVQSEFYLPNLEFPAKKTKSPPGKIQGAFGRGG